MASNSPSSASFSAGVRLRNNTQENIMENKITVNGIEYIRADAANGNIKIVVLERGFVYVGSYSEEADTVTITNARCIVRWGTTMHLAELTNGPLPNTRLGNRCTVKARIGQVIYTLEVNQDVWDS